MWFVGREFVGSQRAHCVNENNQRFFRCDRMVRRQISKLKIFAKKLSNRSHLVRRQPEAVGQVQSDSQF